MGERATTRMGHKNGYRCDGCNDVESIDFCEKHDAFFCAKCDRWLDLQCDDPQCVFQCTQRPARPSEVNDPLREALNAALQVSEAALEDLETATFPGGLPDGVKFDPSKTDPKSIS